MKKKLYLMDAWFLLRIKKPVDKYCKITGKNNFSLAKILLNMSTLILLFGLFIDRSLGLSWVVFGSVVWSFNHLYSYTQIQRTERLAKEQSESGTVTVELLKLILWFGELRRWFVAWSVFFFVLGPVMGDGVYILVVGLVFRFLSHYVACCINFGGKSIYEKSKEKIRDTAKKLKERLPDLAPSPVPA